ncbi:MAG: serine/threonine protein kinase [Planctomycetes bacterium]|nr:serine/threonine protein kinase [Planctomycetota bacterium]
MTPEQYQKAMDIFLAAADLPEQARAARIQELSGGDDQVREQAMRMLRNDRASESLVGSGHLRAGLQQLLDESGAQGQGADECESPEFVGQYRILRRIGSGGMGDVFEALQETPRRSVAVKIMRAGLNSEAMLRRFRREVEFLGRLSHPGIASVFEAGVTSVGAARVPYFAMEFVNGVPLTTYVKENSLTLRAKLELIITICDTVQYAHQQGIIHRDLKPANILVQEALSTADRSGTPSRMHPQRADGIATGAHAPLPGGAMPRILDFGIARAIQTQEGTAEMQASIATEAGQIVGTIPYMSPEQMSARSGGVDTRTDVYALGVMLFEVLAGRLPHDTAGMSLVDASIVKLNEPAMALSAANKEFRGDLDTIAAKALEIDKNRRYQSASELAADLRRYLNDEVITARPATTLYLLRKFTKRNRGLVIAAGVAVLALVGGVIGTAFQAQAAIRARGVAVEKSRLAQRKTEVAEAVSKELYRTLMLPTPKTSGGGEPTLIEAIEQAERDMLDDSVQVDPEARISVLQAIGSMWKERGNLDRAQTVLDKALELCRATIPSDDPRLGDVLNSMGLVRKLQGHVAEAAPLLQEAVDIQRRDPGSDQTRLARNMYNLASTYIALGDLVRAKPLLDDSLEMHRKLLGEENEVIAIHYAAFSRYAIAQGKWDEAEVQVAKAVEMCRKCVGPAHPSIASGLCDYAMVVRHNGDLPRAIALLIESDAVAHQVFPVNPPHVTLKAIRNKLVDALRAAGRDGEAAHLEQDIQAMPS